MMDIYQERYLEHKKRKETNDCVGKYKHDKGQLLTMLDIMNSRRSQRVFNNEEITENEIDLINFSVVNAPSSCNRQAVYLKEAEPMFIDEHFRGANKWGRNAKKGYIVMASRKAYKNPIEVSYMPYLDAGFVCENIYLMCESLNIGCCFVNPNCDLEDEDYICGAILIGKYDKKAVDVKKKERAI